ncbi:hypothetical protein [Granulicoccus sp. GXG6511]|uniref:hypothetical protein n=1 Tax=Granulicoccus sp. GXG6511 TaxID=3381351 RepID=UPI003D7EBDC4
MWLLLQQLGRVPRGLIWHTESGIGGKRRRRRRRVHRHLATSLVSLKPYAPESMGPVERRNGFFETSFMPWRGLQLAGRLRRPVRPVVGHGEREGGAHDQGQISRSARRRQGGDVAAATGRARSGWVNRVRLRRAYYVRIDSNDYCVDPNVIG